MGQLDHSEFACAKCGQVSMRTPPRLRTDPIQICTSCKGDVSDEGQKMLRAVEAAERVPAEDPDKIRRGESLKFKPST